jgi:hypothetical protein
MAGTQCPCHEIYARILSRDIICVHYHIAIENEIVHVQMSRIDSGVRVILLPAEAAFT